MTLQLCIGSHLFILSVRRASSLHFTTLSTPFWSSFVLFVLLLPLHAIARLLALALTMVESSTCIRKSMIYMIRSKGDNTDFREKPTLKVFDRLPLAFTLTRLCRFVSHKLIHTRKRNGYLEGASFGTDLFSRPYHKLCRSQAKSFLFVASPTTRIRQKCVVMGGGIDQLCFEPFGNRLAKGSSGRAPQITIKMVYNNF